MSVFILQSTGKKQHGIYCRFSGSTLSLINALVVALCLKRPDDVKKNLESLGQAWDNYQVYLKDEFNYIDESLLSTPLQKEKEQKL